MNWKALLDDGKVYYFEAADLDAATEYVEMFCPNWIELRLA